MRTEEGEEQAEEATLSEPPPETKPPAACRSHAHAPPPADTVPASEEEVEAHLSRSSVLLFMKGAPDSPRCRFSRSVVEVLRSHGVQFDHIDVLEEPAVRQAMKARWPTFPQLWSEGMLLGGASEVRELASRSELLDALRSSTARERASLALILKGSDHGPAAIP